MRRTTVSKKRRTVVLKSICVVSLALVYCTRIPDTIGKLDYNQVSPRMVFVPGGTFQLGQSGLATPVHQVTVSPFFIDNTDVSQGDYQAIMNVNPSHFAGDSLLPVVSESWYDAVLYCNARSKRDGLDTVYSFTSISGTPGNGCDSLGSLVIDYSQKGYRLPTEAEWEYACRAGSTTQQYWGDAMNLNYCWDTTNSGGMPHRVGQKVPNHFGLYDMNGNVLQWCNDWYAVYTADTQTDPTGPQTGTLRILRGGSWASHDYYVNSACRWKDIPGSRFSDAGFRCVSSQSLLSPVLGSPANGAAGQPLSLTLTWVTVSGAELYYGQVSTDSTFANIVMQDSTLTADSMILGGLAPGTAYYWRVRAMNKGGASAWTIPWSFTTGSTQILSPRMKLIAAAGKSFQMGGTTGYSNELPVHTVSFTYDFWMDTTEVTQVNYGAIMGVNPAIISGSPILPVENVTWFDAVLYCNKRSRIDGIDTVYGYTSITGTAGNGSTGLGNLTIDLSKNGYRLATEAEWEYACRAGTTTDYYWGSGNVDNYEWYISNSSGTTHPVATKLPNAFGLYDMSGNVAEWCNDWFGGYSSGSQADPAGPASGTARVWRGGSYAADLGYRWLQSADRENGGWPPGNRGGYVGFRCVKKSAAAATLLAPTLLSPASSDTAQPISLTLMWTAVSGAATYYAQVSTDSTFAHIFMQDSTLAADSMSLSGLAGGTTYYWRVRAKNAGGVSAWTASWSFTTMAAPQTPTLISPVNNPKPLSSSPTLMWSAVSGAATYYVQVSTGSAFSTVYAQDSTLTADSMKTGALASGTTYFWRVRAKNGAGVSSWTSPWSFAIAAALQAPALVSPGNGATGLSLSPTVVWSPVSGATTYVVMVSTSPLPLNTVYLDSTHTADSLQISGLVANTTYYWWVYATNTGASGPAGGLWSFATGAALQPPALVSPVNGALGQPIALTLSWGSVSGAATYDVQVSTSSSFATILLDDSTLAVASRTITNLTAGSTFYWHVRAKNAIGVSPWSSVWSLTTALPPAAPGVPTLVSPTNGGANQTLAPTLAWSTVTGAATYYVQVSTSTTFTAILSQDSTLTSDSMRLSGLGALTTYYWRVRAKNAGGVSSWTSPWSFATGNLAPAIDIRVGANSVVVDGTKAYVTAGTQFEVYDVSNPQAPVKLGSVTHGYTDVRVEAHAIYNNIVWCVRSSSGGYGAATYVFGVDVSDPANPVLRGSLTLQTASSLLSSSSTIYSGYLLVHDYSRNLIYVINISNPNAPTVFSQWSVPNMVDGGPGFMLIEGTLLYLPCGETKTLKIYNVSNLAAVSLVGSVSFPQEEPYGPVVKIGSYLYLNASVFSGPTFIEAYTEVINVANPASPSIVGTLAPNGYFKMKNNKLFSLNDAKIYSYSLANPAAPVITDSSTVAKPAGTTDLYLTGMAMSSATWVGDYLIGYTRSDVYAYSGIRAVYFPVN